MVLRSSARWRHRNAGSPHRGFADEGNSTGPSGLNCPTRTRRARVRRADRSPPESPSWLPCCCSRGGCVDEPAEAWPRSQAFDTSSDSGACFHPCRRKLSSVSALSSPSFRPSSSSRNSREKRACRPPSPETHARGPSGVSSAMTAFPHCVPGGDLFQRRGPLAALLAACIGAVPTCLGPFRCAGNVIRHKNRRPTGNVARRASARLALRCLARGSQEKPSAR
jgi:hypothetical protein